MLPAALPKCLPTRFRRRFYFDVKELAMLQAGKITGQAQQRHAARLLLPALVVLGLALSGSL